jgi:DNA-binding MarR family transcriptional regulator
MQLARQRDHVDLVLAQWRQVAPDTDVSAMAIFTRLFRLSKYLNRQTAAVFRRHGLRDGEFDLLATLYRSGQPDGLTPQALSRAAVLSSGAMTNRLDRLESAGLIGRQANPLDRRSLLISLSEQGRSVLLNCLTDYLSALRQLQAPLGADERQALTGALRTLLLSLEASEDV